MAAKRIRKEHKAACEALDSLMQEGIKAGGRGRARGFLRNGPMEYGSSQTPGVSTPARIVSANTHTQYNGAKQQPNEKL
jgi:hypothetical protein